MGWLSCSHSFLHVKDAALREMLENAVGAAGCAHNINRVTWPDGQASLRLRSWERRYVTPGNWRLPTKERARQRSCSCHAAFADPTPQELPVLEEPMLKEPAAPLPMMGATQQRITPQSGHTTEDSRPDRGKPGGRGWAGSGGCASDGEGVAPRLHVVPQGCAGRGHAQESVQRGRRARGPAVPHARDGHAP